jgi:hypothetical protein
MCEGVDWIHLAQYGDHWEVLVIMVTNLWIPLMAGNLTSRATISVSRRTLLHGSWLKQRSVILPLF